MSKKVYGLLLPVQDKDVDDYDSGLGPALPYSFPSKEIRRECRYRAIDAKCRLVPTQLSKLTDEQVEYANRSYAEDQDHFRDTLERLLGHDWIGLFAAEHLQRFMSEYKKANPNHKHKICREL